MGSLLEKSLNFKRHLKINFEGGNLTSDAGLVLYREFDEKIGFSKTIKDNLEVKDRSADARTCEFAERMDSLRKRDVISSHVIYGEFMYKASSWKKERRVVVKLEKPEGQMIYNYTFICQCKLFL